MTHCAMTHTLYRNVNDYFRRQGVATAATRELFDLVCNAAATAAAVPGMLRALQDKHAATEEDASDKVIRHFLPSFLTKMLKKQFVQWLVRDLL
jgi:recombinational DNA repair protein (RecF pathway)